MLLWFFDGFNRLSRYFLFYESGIDLSLNHAFQEFCIALLDGTYGDAVNFFEVEIVFETIFAIKMETEGIFYEVFIVKPANGAPFLLFDDFWGRGSTVEWYCVGVFLVNEGIDSFEILDDD